MRNDDMLDPDMPAQELRLHMGELSNNEILVARAAIRWANSKAKAAIDAMQISVRDGFYIGGNKYKSLHDATMAAEPGDVIVVEGGSNKL